MANSMMSSTRHFEQISELIENARSIADLNVIIKQLIPLPELKKILLDKLLTLSTRNEQQNTNVTTSTNESEDSNIDNDSLSLHSLYFNSYPFDEIFSDDIICSVIQYLSGSKMYHKLPQINKNFNKLMREKAILYQQYKIQVTLSDDMWSTNTKKLYVNISHEFQSIEISSTMQHQFPYNTAIPLNSKTAPDEKNNTNKYQTNCHNIIIRSVQDMTNKCPFMWYAIRKWHIITHVSDYDHSDNNTLLSTPTFNQNNNANISPFPATNNIINMTPSPVKSSINNTSVSFPDISIISKENTVSLMVQLLNQSAQYIRSLQIDERIMSASPTGGIFGMYGLYTPHASSHLYLNYNHELNNKKKHIASKILNKLVCLNNLIHIEWITDESATILKGLYFNKCKNIICLDLCGSQGYTVLNSQILTNMDKLNVLSIEFDDLRYVNNASTNNNTNTNEDEKQENKQEIIVKFPVNIEFIQLKNYDHASDIILDLSNCYNIIAIQLTISNKKYKFSNILQTIRWPINASYACNNNYLIECLLIEFSHKSMSPSHDVWNEYISTLKNNKNNFTLPVKCIRCITNTYSQPVYFKMGSYSYNNNSNNNDTETIDHFTYTNLSIKGLGESNEDNSNLLQTLNPTKSNINDSITNSCDRDSILWKRLVYDKYKTVKYGNKTALDKIVTYKTYFAMDIIKWVYHLGRDYGLTTSMNIFDTSSFNNVIPDISTALNTSTISNNIVINPQYINEQGTMSSSSAVFVVD